MKPLPCVATAQTHQHYRQQDVDEAKRNAELNRQRDLMVENLEAASQDMVGQACAAYIANAGYAVLAQILAEQDPEGWEEAVDAAIAGGQ